MKKVLVSLAACLFSGTLANHAVATTQDKYGLPEPYLGWEEAYLGRFPHPQAVMDEMIKATVWQLKEPEEAAASITSTGTAIPAKTATDRINTPPFDWYLATARPVDASLTSCG